MASSIIITTRTLVTPPGSPTNTAKYIVPASGATGAWVGHANQIAWYENGAWAFSTVPPGYEVFVADVSENFTFDGTNWDLSIAGVALLASAPTFTGTVSSPSFASTVANGTAPFTVVSSTPVANLNIGGNAATVTTNANLTGDVVSIGTATSISAATVTGKLLTGLSTASTTAITATDSILTALGKAQAQLNLVSGAMVYMGVWDATANSPALVSGVGVKGNYYKVGTAGTTSIDGSPPGMSGI